MLSKQLRPLPHTVALTHIHTQQSLIEQILREELRTLSKQLHLLDERLDFMEQKMGQRRGWLWG